MLINLALRAFWVVQACNKPIISRFNKVAVEHFCRPLCGPVAGFARSNSDFRGSISTYWQPVLILIILNLTFLQFYSLQPGSCTHCNLDTSALCTGRFPRVRKHLGAKLISALSVPLALGGKLTYILHDITLTDWLKVTNTAFTWHVIIVAFSIVAGLNFVAKFGHNHLCVYMVVLIYRTRALCTTKKVLQIFVGLLHHIYCSLNTSCQHSAKLEK